MLRTQQILELLVLLVSRRGADTNAEEVIQIFLLIHL